MEKQALRSRNGFFEIRIESSIVADEIYMYRVVWGCEQDKLIVPVLSRFPLSHQIRRKLDRPGAWHKTIGLGITVKGLPFSDQAKLLGCTHSKFLNTKLPHHH